MAEAIDLPRIATSVWRDRVHMTDRFVSKGEWTQQQADKRLRPWVAICTLAGCEIDMLPSAAVLAYRELRHPVVHYPGNGAPARYDHDTGDAFARSFLAMDWCPPREWARELGEATNRAAERHEAERTDRALAEWRNLAALSRALEVTVPWYTAPRAADEPERIAA